uniref:ATP-binding cassette transporter n=3 Tax=Diaphorina citri TaxID=121845 RepID=A0A6G5VBJ0_DIACI|nr:ATP-binding cassette transporter [Diaphorina citri]
MSPRSYDVNSIRKRPAPDPDMTTNWAKLCLLMWKNWLLQRRHLVQSGIEIGVPVLLSVILIFIRNCVVATQYEEPTKYESFNTKCTKWEKNWTIAWSPYHPELFNVMSRASFVIGYQQQAFANSSELQDALTQPGAMKDYIAGVVFDDDIAGREHLSRQVKVTIRFPGASRIISRFPEESIEGVGDDNWRTYLMFPLYQEFGPREKLSTAGGEPGYCKEGFLELQDAISKAYIEHFTTSVLPFVQFQRFPYPPYLDDPILPALTAFISTIILLSFVYPAINTIRCVAVEKETKMKEAMKLMGLPNWLHWTAWTIKSQLLWLIPSIIIVGLLTVPWSQGCVIKSTNPLIFLTVLAVYSFAAITQCFLVSVLFNHGSTAATVGGLVWFGTYSPYIILQPKYSLMTFQQKLYTCLFSNSAMGYAFQNLLMYEGIGEGVQWNNVWKSVTPDDELCLGHILSMMAIMGVIHLVAALYIEAVWPGSTGLPLFREGVQWNNVWKSVTPDDELCLGHILSMMAIMGVIHLVAALYIEAVWPGSTGLPLPWYYPIQATYWLGLTKIYKTGKKAVDNLTLDMYQNQITVLLGHNGAGKSTTMSMLTGLIIPTSGTAYIDGHDIWYEMGKVRESLGLCPQYDLLFEELTVEDHLQFFAKLKGFTGDILRNEVKHYLQTFALEPYTHTKATVLSGGLKRKLSVGIALIAQSKVVLLDEPTSGMDPAARRGLWDILQSERQGRTIVMTTHLMDEADLLGDRIAIINGGQLKAIGTPFSLKKEFERQGRTIVMTTHLMDEADLLGDRIAIINGGQLKAIGTPFSLKKEFGQGYSLTLIKDHKGFNESQVTAFIREYCPEGQAEWVTDNEVRYRLTDSSLFPDLLKNLESKQGELHVKEYGLSLTTMEDVFMSVGRDTSQQGHINMDMLRDGDSYNSVGSELNKGSENTSSTLAFYDMYKTNDLNKGFDLWWGQFKGIFTKKYLYARSLIYLHLLQIVMTVCFLSVSILVVRTWQGQKDLPPFTMDLGSDAAVAFYNMFKNLTSHEVADLGFSGPYIQDYILNKSIESITQVTQRYMAGISFSERVITAHFNNQPYHVPPLVLNMIHNIMFNTLTGPGARITVVNYPLPYGAEVKMTKLQGGSNMGFQVAFNLSFSQAFICAIMILFAVKERESGFKHLQFVSGAKPSVYWIAALVWDFCVYLFIIVTVILTLLSFNEPGFKEFGQLMRVGLVMLAFAWAAIPMMSLMSYCFSSPSTSFTRASMLNITTEECFGWDGNYYSWKSPGISRNLTYLFILGLVFHTLLLSIEYMKILWLRMIWFKNRYCKIFNRSPVGHDMTTPFLIEDSDVQLEKILVKKSNPEDYAIYINDLVKRYNGVEAVKGIDLALNSKECFGLLGSNGAGKSSTFKMLTGDTLISSGNAYICNKMIKTSMNKIRRTIGYCPQFDALLEELTGRQSLRLFCQLHGIHDDEIEYVISYLSTKLMFHHYLDVKVKCYSYLSTKLMFHHYLDVKVKCYSYLSTKLMFHHYLDVKVKCYSYLSTKLMFHHYLDVKVKCYSYLSTKLMFHHYLDVKVKCYSGGNKRKLSTAVALIGNPPVVLLDEPTSGLDPAARRHLWDVISSERDSGKCVVVTSHSLEECEALCTRLAVMVNGRLSCLGSVQHLKNKFAVGYQLQIKFPPTTQQNIKWFVAAYLKDSEVVEEYEGMVTFHVPPGIACSQVFSTMEKAKSESLVEDYSIQQTSLEQVFLRFTKSTVPGSCRSKSPFDRSTQNLELNEMHL